MESVARSPRQPCQTPPGSLDRSADHAMEHISSSPVHPHVRRNGAFSHRGTPRSTAAAKVEDPRWQLLDLVRICRSLLGLRDRDIAVLRGLLSFVPASAEPARLTVFASNRALIDRCDGMDERTLRRRIVHLQAKGLLIRRLSPNGKRYQIRDEHAETRLTYGIDLAPLFGIQDHLEALADQQRKEEVRVKSLRAMIRHVLYQQVSSSETHVIEQARLALRRNLDSDHLQAIFDSLAVGLDKTSEDSAACSSNLTASDRQNDRHIQSSEKESCESESMEKCPAPQSDHAAAWPTGQVIEKDLSVGECLELAPGAAEMALETPRSWSDIICLSAALAPAIGLSRSVVDAARRHLGRHGTALAILGLVEAFGRIRNPQAYLAHLTGQAKKGGVDLVRMFRSLVGQRRMCSGLG